MADFGLAYKNQFKISPFGKKCVWLSGLRKVIISTFLGILGNFLIILDFISKYIPPFKYITAYLNKSALAAPYLGFITEKAFNILCFLPKFFSKKGIISLPLLFSV